MTSVLNKYSNLTQRIIAALFGAIIIIGGVSYGPWTYFIVFFAISCLSLIEFYKLSGLDGMLPLKSWGTICGLSIFSLTFFVEMGLLEAEFYYWAFPFLSSVFFIKLYKKFERKPFTNIAFTFLGIIYIALPYALLNICAFSQGGNYSYQIVLGLLLLLWSSDTGAYFAGTKFGKTKLFARVSPKKSWEGSFGGAIFSLLMAWFLSCYFTDLKPREWFSLAVIIVIAGTYGDLIESLLKRSIDIKDSGSIIPGHGGFLDRFDGLIIAIPFILAYLKTISI